MVEQRTPLIGKIRYRQPVYLILRVSDFLEMNQRSTESSHEILNRKNEEYGNQSNREEAF